MNDNPSTQIKSGLQSNRGCFGFVSWVLLVSGLFFLSVVIFKDLRLAVQGELTDGAIIKITERYSSGSGTTQRPGETQESYRNRSSGGVSYDLHVKFTTSKGEATEIKTNATFGHDSKVGDAVKIIYLPNNPTRAEIYSAKQLWLPIYVGFVVSALCLGGGLFLRRVISAADR